MTNFQIYKGTFRFTLMRILTGLIRTALIVGLTALCFAITGGRSDEVRIAASFGGFVVGCILAGLIGHFVSYIFRAGQIAVVAEATQNGKLPDDCYAVGKASVKKRFGTVALFFAIEKIIKAIVSQLTNAVNKLTDKISEDSKNDTVKTISTVIQIVVAAMLKYVSACCMGWVFIHPDVNAWRAACDGAILYFKNWKELLKNTGRVLLIGLLSLAILGGAIFGCCHLALHNTQFMTEMTTELSDFLDESNMEKLSTELELDDDDNSFLEKLAAITPAQWTLIFEGIIALILWGILHGALVEPFMMISVMRGYIQAGLANPPARDVDEKLKGMSKSYKKALESAEA